MHNKLYILSIIVLLCISCSKVSTEQGNGIPVDFATKLEKTTKVDEYFEAGEKMGLFGYNLDNDKVWEEVSLAPEFMYNEVLEYTGTTWETQKEYYWSPRKENRKRFYAYYPYAGNGTNGNLAISPATHEGAPYIDFTVTDGKTDFITCSAKEGNVENPVILFTAKHALAKLSIGFATDIEDGFAYVKALKLNGIKKSGRYTYDILPENGNGFSYDGTETFDLELVQPKEDDGTDKDIIVESDETVYVDEYTVYLLPLNDNEGKGSAQTLETVINGIPKTFDLSSVPLASGKNTSIRIVINQKEIIFTATIGDWERGGAVSGTID